MTPSQARVHQAAADAAFRRRRREIEHDVRQWFKGDFQIVYDAVTRTKLNQAKPGKAVSETLYKSILAAHRARLDKLEQEVQAEINQRLEADLKK